MSERLVSEPAVWLRVPAAMRRTGLGRNSIYDAINSGLVKSVLVRKKGNIKGVRLVSSESLDAYIESFGQIEQSQTEVAEGELNGKEEGPQKQSEGRA